MINPTPESDRARFFAKVRMPEDPIKDCWEWTGAKNAKGYGAFGLGTNKIMRAHKASLILHGHMIPEGSLVCHRCDNPGCVNPRHLFLGSSKDNTQDAVAKSRFNFVNANLPAKKVMGIFTADGTQQEIAGVFGVDQSTVSRIKNGKDYSYLTGAKLKTGRAKKLTASIVDKIRAALGSHRRIGRRFGVDHSVVGRIKRGQAWKKD